MTSGITPANRDALIEALSTLANEIEANPPPIIGSDIFVQGAPGAEVIGSSISVTAGQGAGGGVGQRISVVAQPGQSAIGQRITVVAGDGPVSAPPPGAGSRQEINDAVAQLRDAACVLASSSASEGWIRSIVDGVSKWGSVALSGAVSGASNAVVRFYLTGG
ncbi:hypothetical protein [Acidocella sp.]|uniref:hypothetical protein n=1 Tax=Acidocella sp. TaxID=50710 RepID=UPI0025C4DD18|nr:hypothetical protein [Acidocella sp.]